MKRILIAIGVACWLIQGIAFSEERQELSNATRRSFVLEEQKINKIVTEISASSPVRTNYPFGYNTSPSGYYQTEARAEGKQKGWIKRHPVLFGTIVGFGSGFVIGYAAGDDGIFDDSTASGSGIVLGGIGAGAGALIGAIASH